MSVLHAAVVAVLRTSLLTLAVGMIWAGSARAQDVVLRTFDGATEIVGTLLGFDGDFYRVQSQFGEVTLDATAVDCLGEGCPSLTGFVADVAISGSRTMGEVLMPALLESFARREGLRAERRTQDTTRFIYRLTDAAQGREVAVFRFHLTNTDEGFGDLLANEADIVLALREIRAHEAAAAKEIGLGDLNGPNRSRVLALDALVPVVAANAPLQDIALSDIAAILSGTLSNWSQIGGPDAKINVHLRDEGSGLAQGVVDQLLAPVEAQLRDDIIRHISNSALDTAVAADPHAIGLASYAQVRRARVLDLRGACGFMQSATRFSIKTEDYPTTAPLLIYVPARRLPRLARAFLAYTRSPGAQIVIRRAGFVDQTPEEVPLALQGDRLSNAIAVAEGRTGLRALKTMQAQLAPMQRVTTSFRFDPEGKILDAQSRSNVQQLARALERGDYDRRRLLLAGFSDGSGPAATNREIAQTRAQAVHDALWAAVDGEDGILDDIEIAGFGEAMPMACDDTLWGRQVNRRVEVWVE